MVDDALTPAHGARIVFDRVGVDDVNADYQVTAAENAQHYTVAARIARRDGALTLGEWSTPAPPTWIRDACVAFLKTLYAHHSGPDAPAWPRRIKRWRAAKRSD